MCDQDLFNACTISKDNWETLLVAAALTALDQEHATDRISRQKIDVYAFTQPGYTSDAKLHG